MKLLSNSLFLNLWQYIGTEWMRRVLINGLGSYFPFNVCVAIMGSNIGLLIHRFICVCVCSYWLFHVKCLCNACSGNERWMWNDFMFIISFNEPVNLQLASRVDVHCDFDCACCSWLVILSRITLVNSTNGWLEHHTNKKH